jgi:hypothetical protein
MILRVVLFGILAYMIFALAYDYLYVFPTHEAKYKELMAKVEEETKRSAESNVEQPESTGPKQVAEIVGFNSGGLQDGGHYQYERFSYRRGLPWMTRYLEVYYKGPKDAPFIYSVAHADDEIEEARPKPPVVPSELPEGTPDGEEDEKEMEENDKKKGITPPEEEPKPTEEEPKPTEEEPKPAEPATEDPKTEEPKDDAPTTDEPKTDEPTVEEPKTDDKTVDNPAAPSTGAEDKKDE